MALMTVSSRVGGLWRWWRTDADDRRVFHLRSSQATPAGAVLMSLNTHGFTGHGLEPHSTRARHVQMARDWQELGYDVDVISFRNNGAGSGAPVGRKGASPTFPSVWDGRAPR
jgi:hypothetical protein